MASLQDSASADVKCIVARAAASLGYQLKKEQEESVFQLVSGKDVFVCLPTGYGKSLCYTILPSVFDLLRLVQKKSIVLVISPLSALMKDQIASVSGMGITATYITDQQSATPTIRTKIENGDFQMIFISPESLFCGTQWRRLLCTDVYRKNLVAFVIDEAHCIKNWYVAIGCVM